MLHKERPYLFTQIVHDRRQIIEILLDLHQRAFRNQQLEYGLGLPGRDAECGKKFRMIRRHERRVQMRLEQGFLESLLIVGKGNLMLRQTKQFALGRQTTGTDQLFQSKVRQFRRHACPHAGKNHAFGHAVFQRILPMKGLSGNKCTFKQSFQPDGGNPAPGILIPAECTALAGHGLKMFLQRLSAEIGQNGKIGQRCPEASGKLKLHVDAGFLVGIGQGQKTLLHFRVDVAAARRRIQRIKNGTAGHGPQRRKCSDNAAVGKDTRHGLGKMHFRQRGFSRFKAVAVVKVQTGGKFPRTVMEVDLTAMTQAAGG